MNAQDKLFAQLTKGMSKEGREALARSAAGMPPKKEKGKQAVKPATKKK